MMTLAAVAAQAAASGLGADVLRVGGGPPMGAGPVLGEEQGAAFAAGDEPGEYPVEHVGGRAEHEALPAGGEPGVVMIVSVPGRAVPAVAGGRWHG